MTAHRNRGVSVPFHRNCATNRIQLYFAIPNLCFRSITIIVRYEIPHYVKTLDVDHLHQPKALQYILKLKANPGNPAYDVVFNTKYQILYADKESATVSFGIHCKKLLKKAKVNIGEIANNSIPDVPTGDSEPVTVDFTLSEFDNHLLLRLFLKVDLMR